MAKPGTTKATRGNYSEQYYPNTEELGADEMRVVALEPGGHSCGVRKLLLPG